MHTLLKNPVFPEFIHVSQKFVEEIQILEPEEMQEIKELIDNLNQLDVYGASMNQLGKSVYCFCKPNEVKQVTEIFDSYNPPTLKTLEMSLNTI